MWQTKVTDADRRELVLLADSALLAALVVRNSRVRGAVEGLLAHAREAGWLLLPVALDPARWATGCSAARPDSSVPRRSGLADNPVASRNTSSARRLCHGFASRCRPTCSASASSPSAFCP